MRIPFRFRKNLLIRLFTLSALLLWIPICRKQRQSTLHQHRSLASHNEKFELSGALLNAEKERSRKEQMSVELELHRNRQTPLQNALLMESNGKDTSLVESVKLVDAAESARKKSLELALMNYTDDTGMLQATITHLSNELTVAQGLNAELASAVEGLEQRLAKAIFPEFSMSSFSQQVFAVLMVVGWVFIFAFVKHWHSDIVLDMNRKNERICDMEREMRAEFAGMVGVGDWDGGLKQEFGFSISDSETNLETVRTINIQCPGVKHADVEVDLISNGCTITICRQASRIFPSSKWTRRFQFKQSDGLFEFREEQMLLEDGILQLVFQANAFQSRRVLFARHFNLTETDTDATWDFSAEAEQNDDADAWWNDNVSLSKYHQGGSKKSDAKWQESSIDVDTQSTASTIREIV